MSVMNKEKDKKVEYHRSNLALCEMFAILLDCNYSKCCISFSSVANYFCRLSTTEILLSFCFLKCLSSKKVSAGKYCTHIRTEHTQQVAHKVSFLFFKI